MEPEAEKPRRGWKPRITVSRVEEPGSQMLPAVPNLVQALIASPQLQLVLDSIKSIDEMHTLHEQVAAWEDVQKRMAAANEEIVKIATVRLRLERKIGAHLAETVKWGGHGSRSDSLTSIRGGSSGPLPQGINKQRASWYRSIAKVPEDVFEAFLTDRATKGKPPSATALLKCVPKKSASRPRQPKAGSNGTAAPPHVPRESVGVGLTPEILGAVARLMDVDLVVGEGHSAWPQAAHAHPDALRPAQLSGRVFVGSCPDPASWLMKLARARSEAKVAQVVVVLPPVHWAEWFKQLEAGGWFCCFTPHAIVAYCGERTHAFKVTFDEMGAVMRSSE